MQAHPNFYSDFYQAPPNKDSKELSQTGAAGSVGPDLSRGGETSSDPSEDSDSSSQANREIFIPTQHVPSLLIDFEEKLFFESGVDSDGD